MEIKKEEFNALMDKVTTLEEKVAHLSGAMDSAYDKISQLTVQVQQLTTAHAYNQPMYGIHGHPMGGYQPQHGGGYQQQPMGGYQSTFGYGPNGQPSRGPQSGPRFGDTYNPHGPSEYGRNKHGDSRAQPDYSQNTHAGQRGNSSMDKSAGQECADATGIAYDPQHVRNILKEAGQDVLKEAGQDVIEYTALLSGALRDTDVDTNLSTPLGVLLALDRLVGRYLYEAYDLPRCLWGVDHYNNRITVRGITMKTDSFKATNLRNDITALSKLYVTVIEELDVPRGV